MKLSRAWRSRVSVGGACLLAYGVLYVTALFCLAHEGLGIAEPLLVLAIVGVGFSALAWWLTRGAVALRARVERPGRETALLAAYLILVAAFITWGLGYLEEGIQAQPLGAIAVVAAKVVVFVAIPFALLRWMWPYRVRDFLPPFASWRRHWLPAVGMSLALILFQLVFGRGLATIRRSGLSAGALVAGVPFVFAWLLIEVGLVEEFFFRVLLQSRLAAWLRSEVGGIVVMATLFGLAHAPGLHYRSALTHAALGAHPSWLLAISYSIVVISVTGFFFGVLWARTRNLVLLMVVHAAGDLLPNLVTTLSNWGWHLRIP